MGHCQIYTCAIDRGLDDMRKGLEIAIRIGNRHTQMFATQSLGMCLTAAGRYAEAEEFQARRAGASARGQGAALRGRDSRAERGSRFVQGPQGRRAGAGSRGLGDCRGDRTGLCRSAHPRSASACGGHAREDEGLRWPPERRCSRKARSATTISGSGATRSSGRSSTRNGTRPRGRPTRCCLRTADEPLAYATCVATRARVLARRGRGDATEADEKALEQALAIAAASDVRIDALGIALRRK